VKIRVHFTDGGPKEYDANAVDTARDGALVLSKRHLKKAVLAGQPDELTNKVVRVIRRDLWREAEVLDASDADVIELGQRPVSVAN
jgi:hypothetical protein